MLLSYSEILKRIESPKKYSEFYGNGKGLPIIEPFNKKSLQGVSYDVHIDKTIMRQNNSENIVHLSMKSEIDCMFSEVEIDDGYLLSPNEYILAPLVEKFNMPDDLAGHIRPRTTMNKLGLLVVAQHINPSFCGKLYLGIKNISNSIIEILPGISIAQCVFESFNTGIPKECLYRNRKESKYQHESKFIESKVYDEKVIKKADDLLKIILTEE